MVEPGSGYRIPPNIIIAEGAEGCAGVELEAVLSTELYHEVTVIPGIGMVCVCIEAVFSAGLEAVLSTELEAVLCTE